jgi:hypothetical protein
LLRRRPLALPERDPRGLLKREVARGKRVRMADAEQQIDIRGPRSDTLDRDERGMRLFGRHVPERIEIDRAVAHGAGDRLEGADFRDGKPRPLQLGRACSEDRLVMKRIESGRQPPPDRRRTRG